MSLGFDVIVVGAGHAGQEAALAAARVGASVALVTPNLDRVAHMACNCSIGGPAKGHLVCEVDALGGEIGKAADDTCTHIRMLNTSKGPAVRALRVQADKRAYEDRAKLLLETTPGLSLIQSEVAKVAVEGGRVAGVTTTFGERLRSPAVVIATGTFLNASIFYGHTSHPLGRAGEPASTALAQSLAGSGLRPLRLKTGTVPRISLRSVDTDALDRQDSDPEIHGFSWRTGIPDGCVHHPCFVTRATAETIDLVKRHLADSALYGGLVSGPGPRYCPSIEAKVKRFPDKDQHTVFLEREGRGTGEIYVQGLSNSLPPEIQREILHTMPGLSEAVILRYGYAVEYDAFDPRDLTPGMESVHLPGLFLAGQVNGTSGYEEAAAQGLLAGANAAGRAGGGEGLCIPRLSGYIGVMVADLIEKGVDEPYRMMTARAVNRLHLRASSALHRLTPLGRDVGLVEADQWADYLSQRAAVERVEAWFSGMDWPRGPAAAWPGGDWGPAPTPGRGLAELAERPHIPLSELAALAKAPDSVMRALADPRAGLEASARLKHRGYLRREQERVSRTGDVSLRGLDFAAVAGLKAEAVERLERLQPNSLREAAQMRGITAADLDALEVFARRATWAEDD